MRAAVAEGARVVIARVACAVLARCMPPLLAQPAAIITAAATTQRLNSRTT
jgi:hypothetical protein